ncbi:hypothetical protein MNB_SV-13-1839 [hydrothermal vent metagenome]|uniref:Uncharacterized protein n=1 Tax=hydrothermal vent metagenome TaxID=652676 RepID=A0A1W1CYY0_9ZZZZ
MKAPTLSIDIPAQIAENNISIEVNGVKNQKVYINDVEVGIIGTEGTLVIRLPLNMGENSFSITLTTL